MKCDAELASGFSSCALVLQKTYFVVKSNLEQRQGTHESEIKATKGITGESKGWYDGVKMKISQCGINR